MLMANREKNWGGDWHKGPGTRVWAPCVAGSAGAAVTPLVHAPAGLFTCMKRLASLQTGTKQLLEM